MSIYTKCDPEWLFSLPSKGLALDVVIVSPVNDKYDDINTNSEVTNSTKGTFASSDFHVTFPEIKIQMSCCSVSAIGGKDYIILLQVNDMLIDPSFLSMIFPCAEHGHQRNTKRVNHTIGVNKRTTSTTASCDFQRCVFRQGKSTKPPTQVLAQLVKDKILNPGKNSIRYVLASYNCQKYHFGHSNNINHKQTWSKSSLLDYEPIETVSSCIYLWSVNDKIMVVDIDGTVTKSDVRGVISSIVTEKYDHVHDGVCQFFTNIVNNKHSHIINNNDHNTSETTYSSKPHIEDEEELKGDSEGKIRILYLSSRPIHLINSTRKFISQLSQYPLDDEENERSYISAMECFSCTNPSTNEDNYDENDTEQSHHNLDKKKEKHKITSQLPHGPIFLHTGSLSDVLVLELIKKSAHEYKADTLIRQVVSPFVAAADKTLDRIFLAGFGNKDTDVKAYTMVGIRQEDIFIINKNSELICSDDNNDCDKQTNSVTGPFDRKQQSFSGYDDPQLTIAIVNRIKDSMS